MISTDACSSECCSSRRAVSCDMLYKFCTIAVVFGQLSSGDSCSHSVSPSTRAHKGCLSSHMQSRRLTSITPTVSPNPREASYVSRKFCNEPTSLRFVSIAGEISPILLCAFDLTFWRYTMAAGVVANSSCFGGGGSEGHRNQRRPRPLIMTSRGSEDSRGHARLDILRRGGRAGARTRPSR